MSEIQEKSSRFILTSEILNNLLDNNEITLLEKYQRNSGKNYFFTPTISLKLYKPKITWIDPQKKNLSFSFIKHENLSLYTFLKNVNNSLNNLYKNKAYNPVKNIYPFFIEKGNYFYVKCYLPNLNKKYNINSYFNDKEELFSPPLINSVYDSVIVDIRNIWEKDLNAGFNLELKCVYINS